MKKVLIIFNKTKDPNFTRQNEITNAIKRSISKEIEIDTHMGYDDLILDSTSNELNMYLGGKNIKNYKLVYFYTVKDKNRDIAGLIANFCSTNNIKFINSREGFNLNGGKLLQKILLTNNNLNTPKFYFDSKTERLSYESIKDKLGEIFILKQTSSTLGKGVHKITNKLEFDAKVLEITNLKVKSESVFFCEEYIPHTNTYRGIVTGNDCKVIIKVDLEIGGFKTNHGNAVFSNDVPEEFKAICVKAAQIMKLEVSGIDCIYDEQTKKCIILEVNKSPGITTEKIFEGDAIAEYINSIT